MQLIRIFAGLTTKTRQVSSLSRSLTSKALPERKNEDRDIFGTLSDRKLDVMVAEKYLPDDKDNYDKQEHDLKPRKNLFYYKYEIRKYARQGSVGLRKALELFHTMKREDRLTPDLDSFSPLIYGCAKAGYTKRAFELYRESLNYFSKPTKSTVTCLINACAESPFPEYGLERLKWFLHHLKVSYNYSLNKIQYNSAIKAYGKLGQLEEASKLIKEMIDDRIFPELDTFNMLLMGCASDKEAGAILALKVYKRMKLYEIQPDLSTYRIILRCIRDCGVGSPELVRQTLGELPAMTTLDQKLLYNARLNKKRKNQEGFEWAPLLENLGDSIGKAVKSTPEAKMLASNKKESSLSHLLPQSDEVMSSLSSQSSLRKLPNLLSDDHLDILHRIDGIQYDKLKNASNRLILFGGMHGFLEIMMNNHCKPDNKTFSLLLQCISHTRENQIEYFRLAQDYSIKRDLLFYDLLIRHICINFHDTGRLKRAHYFIEQMHRDGLRPNISTFESLANGCETLTEAKQLLSDVEHAGFVVSSVMIKNIFNRAISKKDFKFITGLIELSRGKDFKPTQNLVEQLEGLRLEARELILKCEKSQLRDCDKPNWMKDLKIESFDNFSLKLGRWLGSVELKQDEHPWEQFKVETESKVKGFKEFVKEFKALEEVKQDILERGGKFGNLAAKVKRIL